MDKTYPLPNPGTATDATKAANAKVFNSLPLSDQSDFEKAGRGFIAKIDGPIETDDGRTVMDANVYAFLDGPPPDTANPSLLAPGTTQLQPRPFRGSGWNLPSQRI